MYQNWTRYIKQRGRLLSFKLNHLYRITFNHDNTKKNAFENVNFRGFYTRLTQVMRCARARPSPDPSFLGWLRAARRSLERVNFSINHTIGGGVKIVNFFEVLVLFFDVFFQSRLYYTTLESLALFHSHTRLQCAQENTLDSTEVRTPGMQKVGFAYHSQAGRPCLGCRLRGAARPPDLLVVCPQRRARPNHTCTRKYCCWL